MTLDLFWTKMCVQSLDYPTSMCCCLVHNDWFLTIRLFLPFLEVNLKGLKQFKSNGYKAWDVWNGNVIMSKPNFSQCFIVCTITCEPCPTRINRCWLNWNMPPRIDLLKNDKKTLWIERMSSIPSFALPYMFFFFKCIFNPFTLECVKNLVRIFLLHLQHCWLLTTPWI